MSSNQPIYAPVLSWISLISALASFVTVVLAVINSFVSPYRSGNLGNSAVGINSVEMWVGILSFMAAGSKNVTFPRRVAIGCGFLVLVLAARTGILMFLLTTQRYRYYSNLYGLEWGLLVIALIFLSAYSTIFALLIKHAIRNKKEADAAAYDKVDSHSELSTTDPEYI